MKLDVARETALRILYKIEEENGYSNLVLDEYLKKQRGKQKTKERINFGHINNIRTNIIGINRNLCIQGQS